MFIREERGRQSTMERRRRPSLHVFQVARMGVKVPVLSSPPPKDPIHRSSLTPGCYRQRAVRRVEELSPSPSSSLQRGAGITAWPVARSERPWTRPRGRGWWSASWEQRASSSSASRRPLLRLVPRTKMEVLNDGSPGPVRLLAAKTNWDIRLAGGAARPPCPCLFRPLPARGRRLVRPTSAALRPVVTLDRHLNQIGVLRSAGEREARVPRLVRRKGRKSLARMSLRVCARGRRHRVSIGERARSMVRRSWERKFLGFYLGERKRRGERA